MALVEQIPHQVVLPELLDADWTINSTEAPESDLSTDTFSRRHRAGTNSAIVLPVPDNQGCLQRH